jgi:integrase
MKAEIDRGMKPTTARMVYKAVKFYLRSMGFRNFELDAEDKPRMIYDGSRRVTKDHIRELWDNFSANYKARNRAILLTLKDSGLRISDIARLDAEQYRGAREITVKGEKFRVFEPFATMKTGDYAHIHLGPEAVKAVEEYLGERQSGPLFLSLKGGRMCSKAVSEVFHQTKVRRSLKADFSKISAHSLRKFHWSSLPINEGWICWLQGKATSVYLDEPAVTDAYVKNYDVLRVFGTHDVELEEARSKQDQHIADMEKEIRDLKADFAEVMKVLKRSECAP